MAIVVTEEAPQTLDHEGIRLWENPDFADKLGSTRWLVARRRDQILATWMVPIENTNEGIFARRGVRALPYSSPRIMSAHPKKRREIVFSMVSYLQSNFAGFELPLAPYTCDYGAFAQKGSFLEARQTHVIQSPGLASDQLTSKARNAINAAARSAKITIRGGIDTFNFDAAIVDTSAENRAVRRSLAESCAAVGGATIIEASVNDVAIGQALALHDKTYALLMHSWFDKHSGVRGIPTLLIVRLAAYLFANKRIKILDLEGSILASVDQFMDGIGATPVPYAIAYWYPSRQLLLERLNASIDIPSRKLSKINA